MSVVALARDLGSTRHDVLHVLGDHLQVVWGALVAFVVVMLLTPAIGNMARHIGAVQHVYWPQSMQLAKGTHDIWVVPLIRTATYVFDTLNWRHR